MTLRPELFAIGGETLTAATLAVLAAATSALVVPASSMTEAGFSARQGREMLHKLIGDADGVAWVNISQQRALQMRDEYRS